MPTALDQQYKTTQGRSLVPRKGSGHETNRPDSDFAKEGAIYQDDTRPWRTIGGGGRFRLHSQCLYPYGKKVLTGISSGDWWCANLRSVSVAFIVTVFPAGMAGRKEVQMKRR